jgi:hypothetical protein
LNYEEDYHIFIINGVGCVGGLFIEATEKDSISRATVTRGHYI